LITLAIGKAIEEGILERKTDKESAALQEEEDAKRAVDTAREVVSRGDDESADGKRKRVKTADVAEEAAPVVEEAAPVAEVSAPVESTPEVEAAAPSEEEPAA
jgi:small subunit ribosomal protein S2